MNFEKNIQKNIEQKEQIAKTSISQQNANLSPSNGKRSLGQELAILKANQEEIMNKIAEQEEYLEYLVLQIKRIRKYIFWNYVGEFIKLLLVLLPIIAAYFALKPMIMQAWEAWQNLNNSLHSISGGSTDNLNNLNIFKNIIK